MSRSLLVHVILTENASEIPYGVLSDGSFVTADLSTFLDAMLKAPAAVGLVNLADLDTFESAESMKRVQNERMFFYIPADRVKALDAEVVPVPDDAHLEKQEKFYWVHRGSSFQHSLAVAQFAQDSVEKIVLLSNSRHPGPSSSSTTKGAATTTLPRVLLRIYPHYKRVAPNWLWRFSYRLARKILK